MSESTKAVFLSYAREDTAAARRIAEALRGFGVEVWFDQSELRGGDQWDAKIRTQIKACALFIPIVSDTTQARDEGYFRLEWKLADDRSHLMAQGKAFIVPVVVDDTPEAGTAVPDSFSRAQWTRLAGGVPTPAFIEQVKRLLETPKKSVAQKSADRGQNSEVRHGPKKAGVPGWIWAATAVVIVGVVGIVALRQPASVAAPPAVAPTKPATSAEISAQSVAVLAFANLSDDKGADYFSDGISEELLNVLAKVPKLKVAARTSSFSFKGQNVPIPEIARKLGVAYVVEGSVRKAGNKVRITAQLIKAEDGFHVWSETYDRELKDIFAVQDEIAKNILAVVKGSLLGETELPHLTTTKIEAYTIYLQAQGAFAKRGEVNLREAIRLFDAALAIDPDYVPALAGRAQAGVVLPNYAYVTGAQAREMSDSATQAARRALKLDPQNAKALTVIGWAAFQFDWRWDEGTAGIARARDLAPNDSWTWNCLGDCHRMAGDVVQGLKDKQRAWELDPISPVTHWDLGYSNLVGGRYAEAIRWANLTIAISPRTLDSYMPGLLAAGRAGRFDEMHRMLALARQNMQEGEGMLHLTAAHCAILEKNFTEARRLLVLAAALTDSGQVPPAYLGYLYLLLGEADKALVWLQRAGDQHDPSLIWIDQIDLEVIAANPITRPILEQPQLNELREIRQRNARAGLNKL